MIFSPNIIKKEKKEKKPLKFGDALFTIDPAGDKPLLLLTSGDDLLGANFLVLGILCLAIFQEVY